MKKIIFRADGSPAMGLGHIVRSGALAGIWSGSYHTTFITRCGIPELQEEVRQRVSDLIVLPAEMSIADEVVLIRKMAEDSDVILVLDGYHFDTAYQDNFSKGRLFILSIDDIHAFPFHCHAVINSAGGIAATDYTGWGATRYFLGPEYALLREPFLSVPADGTVRSGNSILICMGGSDPGNITSEILSVVFKCRVGSEINIVLGSAFAFTRSLEKQAAESGADIRLHRNLDAGAMASLMQRCGTAVCSPSTVSYEYLNIGGILYLRQIADNQADMMHYLVGNGLALDFKDFPAHINQENNTRVTQLQTFDHKNRERLISLADQFFFTKTLMVRIALPADSATVFSWINDPAVRSQSFSQAEITLQEHEKWFAAKLDDEDCVYFLLSTGSAAMGQIRFQLRGDSAKLSYLLDPSFRGQGLGSVIISEGIRQLLTIRPGCRSITGFVKKNNHASNRSFQKLRFFAEESAEHQGSFKYTLTV